MDDKGQLGRNCGGGGLIKGGLKPGEISVVAQEKAEMGLC